MTIYYLVSIVVGGCIILLIIRAVAQGKKKITDALFAEALRNENSGDFETAMITYTKALNEVNKIRFHNQFKNKIIEKLKVLHTTIEYKKGLGFHRYAN